MALHSPAPETANFRDPYELERLAEELASREGNHVSALALEHDLPLYVPLAHNNPHLIAEKFNVEEFLLSRSYTSLPDLRKELRDYLLTLKEELVQLINDDYEAFISLSTDLQGEGTRLAKLKAPLGSLRSHILESRKDLLVIQNAIQDKLNKRTVLREEKALLHLLLRISDSVSRLETLLHIASPDGSQAEFKVPTQFSNEDNTDERSRNNRATHLSRVASEYTQLLYHANKARAEQCKFVDEIQWVCELSLASSVHHPHSIPSLAPMRPLHSQRIDRVQSTLSSDLDHLFGSILSSLTDSKGISDVEKSKLTAELTECLRSYDTLGLWRDAEDVLRRDVVRGFVKKTIHPTALAAPPSPIIPHTPFTTSSSFATSPLPPRTPYTPYTALTAKQQSSLLSATLSNSSPYAHILSEDDHPLAKLYNQIIRFIERDISRIMNVADKVSITSTSSINKLPLRPATADRAKPVFSNSTDSEEKGFQIMANVIWEEIARAIMDELGGTVFAAGRPNDFRKNYELTQAFIRALEFLAPSLRAAEALRAHSLFSAFEKRWQLPVYFQLRWKEVIGKLEESLAVRRLELTSSTEKRDYASVQANAIWIAVSACWSAEVYIPELANRLWRLMLQILSRYRNWLVEYLTEVQHLSGLDSIDKTAPQRIQIAIPSSDPVSAEAFVTEGQLLEALSAVIIDVRALSSNVTTLWQEEISIILPEPSEPVDQSQPEEAIQHSLSSLTAILPTLSREIITVISRRCCESLLPMRSIPSQFRAMSNKRLPTEPSYFVGSILRPLKAFFGIRTVAGDGNVAGGLGARLKDDFLMQYVDLVFDCVTERYIYYLSAMKKTEESLRRLKKGKKSGFSLFGSAAGKDDDVDEERIRVQMVLDVQAFGKDAESLGVRTTGHEMYQTLLEMVHSIDSSDAAA